MNVSCKYWVLGMCCLVSMPLFSQNFYLEINLNDPAIQGGLRVAKHRPALEIFRVIEKAGKDKKINGIVLNIGAFSGSREYAWELRNALEQFKSGGKKICAFISAADMDVYCLASVADKIVMDELGTLDMLGYSWGRGYVKHTLSKLGIGVRELRFMEYKSAAEMFTRDSMSEADRRQSDEYLDDIFNLTRGTLMKARNWTAEEFDEIINKDFLYSARNALERKLIDRIGRKDAVNEAIKEMEGAQVKDFFLYGDSVSGITDDPMPYAAPKAGGLFRRPPVIAIVNANGQTDMTGGIGALNLAKTIRELADNKRVKAVVVRINSPGGSAEAADYIDEAVRYAKEKKPVVFSMGQVAASGGYWAAMNATHITATPYTVTGSIGVIGSWFYDNGFNSKLGLNVDILKRGAHSDLMSGFFLPYRDLGADEEERYKSYIMDLYGGFVGKVAAARGMEIDKVEAVAQGRIFSGTAALNAGLIDSVGGLSDAIRKARELAAIPEGKAAAYREFPKLKFFDRLMEGFPLLSLLRKGKSGVGANAGASGFGAASSLVTDMLLPADIRYRLERNGKIMPMLPMDCYLHNFF